MLRLDLRFASVLALALIPFACGGESSSDGSGGSATGGSGGSTSGGSGGSVSGGGGSATGGSGGTGACGPVPGGMDCFTCGELDFPSCVNGSWTCPESTNCPDAAVDATPTCPANQVPTSEGCLTCSDASTKLYTALEAARKANAACGTAADCVLTGSGTTCAGACQIAVSKAGEAAFKTALSKLDADYCSDFVAVCGYSTPKCAVPTLECTGGLCETKFN